MPCYKANRNNPCSQLDSVIVHNFYIYRIVLKINLSVSEYISFKEYKEVLS